MSNTKMDVVDMNTMCLYSSEKAGMAGADKEYINKVIYDNSKDTSHFQNQQRKAGRVAMRIDRMKKKVELMKQHSYNR